MRGNVVSVERVIAAPPDRIFGYLADAAKHQEIDGSGTLRGPSGAPQRLQLGSRFGMAMHAGVPYRMSNEVVEFEENRRIAWQAQVAGPLGVLIGGRIWRYVLEPVDGGTKVTESWDISKDRQRFALRFGGLPERTKRNMENTLARLAEIVERGAPET